MTSGGICVSLFVLLINNKTDKINETEVYRDPGGWVEVGVLFGSLFHMSTFYYSTMIGSDLEH